MKRTTIHLKAVVIGSLSLIALVLSSCALIGGGDDTARQEQQNLSPSVVFGNQATLIGNGALMCSQACSDRGFCGTDAAGTRVVLLNSAGPSTITQDLIMPENTVVTILGAEKQEAVVKSTQEQIMIDYYLVNAAELGQGWVSGWCIGQ